MQIEHELTGMRKKATDLPTFMIAMLQIARVFTLEESERAEISTEQISRMMKKWHYLLPMTYTPRSIIENLYLYHGEISGFGLKIDWKEVMPEDGRKLPRYQFTIRRCNESA